MKIVLDDWLVIIERDNTRRVFNTEMWPEWGNVGVTETSEAYKLYAERRVIESALLKFFSEYQEG